MNIITYFDANASRRAMNAEPTSQRSLTSRNAVMMASASARWSRVRPDRGISA